MARHNSTFVNISDVKYDLLKIIEPWDGKLGSRQTGPVFRLFNSYLRDMRRSGQVREYYIESTVRDTAITYDISIKFSADRSPKKLKIHVGTFKFPWTTGGKYAKFA